jgi:hypothetical protein
MWHHLAGNHTLACMFENKLTCTFYVPMALKTSPSLHPVVHYSALEMSVFSARSCTFESLCSSVTMKLTKSVTNILLNNL